jgi:hypothetical protein
MPRFRGRQQGGLRQVGGNWKIGGHASEMLTINGGDWRDWIALRRVCFACDIDIKTAYIQQAITTV